MSRPAPTNAQNKPHPLRRLQLEGGAVIYEKGESSDALYRIVTGEVRISPPRRRKGLEPVELGPGAIFGQAGLFTGQSRRDGAIATTDTLLDVMRRDDVLKLLDSHDEAARSLISGLFEMAGRREADPPRDNGSDDAAEGIPLVRLLLKPASRPLAAWIGREPIEITRFPFIVGRTGEDDDEAPQNHIDLALEDNRPYQLSRQHFVIDTIDGELVIRDAASYHGTTVNNQRIGRAGRTSVAPLRIGENSIVAGSSDSPYSFTLLIEAS